MIQIMLSDLVYLNEAARALKASNVMWIQNKLVSIDNLNYILYCTLDESKLSVIPYRGLIFNQRNMSKFMKGMPDSSYLINDSDINSSNLFVSSTIPDISVTINLSAKMDAIIMDKLSIINSYDTAMASQPEECMSDKLSDLYKMTQTSAAKLYKPDDSHVITLFGGILPLNKADKLYMALYDNTDNTFLVRFKVVKKQFNIYSYIRYLSI